MHDIPIRKMTNALLECRILLTCSNFIERKKIKLIAIAIYFFQLIGICYIN